MKKRKKRDLDEDSEYSEDERGTAMDMYDKIKRLDGFICAYCSTRIGHHYRFSNPFQSKTERRLPYKSRTQYISAACQTEYQ